MAPEVKQKIQERFRPYQAAIKHDFMRFCRNGVLAVGLTVIAQTERPELDAPYHKNGITIGGEDAAEP